jgi:hypothetical protein
MARTTIPTRLAARPRCEPLESRNLLSGSTFSLSGGALVFDCGPADDYLIVQRGANATVECLLNGAEAVYPASAVREISIFNLESNDLALVDRGLGIPTYVDGRFNGASFGGWISPVQPPSAAAHEHVVGDVTHLFLTPEWLATGQIATQLVEPQRAASSTAGDGPTSQLGTSELVSASASVSLAGHLGHLLTNGSAAEGTLLNGGMNHSADDMFAMADSAMGHDLGVMGLVEDPGMVGRLAVGAGGHAFGMIHSFLGHNTVTGQEGPGHAAAEDNSEAGLAEDEHTFHFGADARDGLAPHGMADAYFEEWADAIGSTSESEIAGNASSAQLVTPVAAAGLVELASTALPVGTAPDTARAGWSGLTLADGVAAGVLALGLESIVHGLKARRMASAGREGKRWLREPPGATPRAADPGVSHACS